MTNKQADQARYHVIVRQLYGETPLGSAQRALLEAEAKDLESGLNTEWTAQARGAAELAEFAVAQNLVADQAEKDLKTKLFG